MEIKSTALNQIKELALTIVTMSAPSPKLTKTPSPSSCKKNEKVEVDADIHQGIPSEGESKSPQMISNSSSDKSSTISSTSIDVSTLAISNSTFSF